MRLILIRHGLTDENLTDILQSGQGESLNERGRQQAELLARRLSIHKIDGIYSSDLPRAWQTAQSISRTHRPLVPMVDRRLRERSVGVMGGRASGDFAEAANDDGLPHSHYRPRGGEALTDVAERAATWHEDALRRHYGQLVVVVTHGAWLRAYLNWLLHGNVDDRNRLYKHYNTGMTVIDLHESKPKLIMLNDISHLE